MVRVLMVNNHGRVTGGADRHCLALVELLRQRGDEVRLLATEHPENEARNVRTVPLLTDRRSRDGMRGRRAAGVAVRALWNSDAAAAMEELLGEFAPDVVHAHKLYPQLSVAPVVVAARRGVPVVQTAHDYEFVSASPFREAGRLDREDAQLRYRALNSALFAVKRLRHVPRVGAWVVPTRYVQQRHRDAGIESVVLPYFVPRTGTAPGRASRNGIAFVGRLQEEKGVRHVIELARTLEEPVRVAGDGDLRGEVEREARRLANLEYLGQLSEAGVRGLLERSAVSVMPSLWPEPGGIAALEAMSVGTPVVGYEVGGLAEYVTDSRAGVAVRPLAADLATACRLLLDDRDRWAECSTHGPDAVARLHDASGYVERLCEVYERVAEVRRA